MRLPLWVFGLIIATLSSAHLLLLMADYTSQSAEFPTLGQAHCVMPTPGRLTRPRNLTPFQEYFLAVGDQKSRVARGFVQPR